MTGITERLSASGQIVGVLALPSPLAASLERACPLPIPELHRLPRDGSMLYGIERVDASGRVANRDIIKALGWQSGDRVEVVTTPQAIVIHASPGGLLCIVRTSHEGDLPAKRQWLKWFEQVTRPRLTRARQTEQDQWNGLLGELVWKCADARRTVELAGWRVRYEPENQLIMAVGQAEPMMAMGRCRD